MAVISTFHKDWLISCICVHKIVILAAKCGRPGHVSEKLGTAPRYCLCFQASISVCIFFFFVLYIKNFCWFFFYYFMNVVNA